MLKLRGWSLSGNTSPLHHPASLRLQLSRQPAGRASLYSSSSSLSRIRHASSSPSTPPSSERRTHSRRDLLGNANTWLGSGTCRSNRFGFGHARGLAGSSLVRVVVRDISTSHNSDPARRTTSTHATSNPNPPSSPSPDLPTSSHPTHSAPTPGPQPEPEPELRESPYTIPNFITSLRIASCPLLGYLIVHGQMDWACGLLALGGFSDWLDGYIARTYKMTSVFGTILDPAADKALMTTLVISLGWSGLLPIPLAALILGRDVALSFSAFYYRYISLPEPKTFKRYWDFSIPSAEVRPTQISKYNTALQLLLMGCTTVSPLLGVDVSLPLQALQWTVAGTTIWSGLSYVGTNNAVKILRQTPRKP